MTTNRIYKYLLDLKLPVINVKLLGNIITIRFSDNKSFKFDISKEPIMGALDRIIDDFEKERKEGY